MKYYIKNNLVFSSLTSKVKVIDKVENIEIPSTTKSHLINNKIIITDIEKIIKNIGRNFEISQPIKNFEEIKKKILENKSKLKKVTSNDYEFIEKTSGLEIIKSLLLSIENSNLNQLNKKLEEYISKTQKQELQKNTEIDELIEIEKNKILDTQEKKKKVLSEASVKKLEELEIEKEKISKEIEKNEITIAKYRNPKNEKLNQILTRQEEINHEIQDLKHLIKVTKTQIKSLKAELKLGNSKQFNWITGILMVLTLGLIYWSKFTDKKYFVLRNQKNIAKYEEKISKLEHEKFNLEKEVRNENKKSANKEVENSKKEEISRKKIDDLNIKQEKISKKILELENSIKKEDSKIEKYDKDITKIEIKITDLKATRKEFEKYSTSKIQEKLKELTNLKDENINELKRIRNKIKSQEINIDGEYIGELE